MSLLAQIIEEATSSETPLTDVLRRCKILAVRLDYEPLATWVAHELNGYPDATEAPAYRKLVGTSASGRFSGFAVGGWMTTDAEIGKSRLPEVLKKHEGRLFEHVHVGGIASIEDVRGLGDEAQDFRVPWPPEAAHQMSNRVIDGFQCEAAWVNVPRSATAQMLDAIRNRVLDFALAIEKESPDAGDVGPGDPPAVPQEQVATIFNTTIYGGQNVLAVGHGSSVANVQQGDWSGLRDALIGLGFQEEDVEELQPVLDREGLTGSAELGPEAKGWIERAKSRMRSAGGAVSLQAAGEVAGGLILRFLGAG